MPPKWIKCKTCFTYYLSGVKHGKRTEKGKIEYCRGKGREKRGGIFSNLPPRKRLKV